MKIYTFLFALLFAGNLFGQEMFDFYREKLALLKAEHYTLFLITSNTQELRERASIVHQKADILYSSIKEYRRDFKDNSKIIQLLETEIYNFVNFTDGLGYCDCHKLFKNFLAQYDANTSTYITSSEGVHLYSAIVGNYKIYYIFSEHKYSAMATFSYASGGSTYERKVGLWNETEIVNISPLSNPISNPKLSVTITDRTPSSYGCGLW